jgi:dolichyl-phosphate-mannose--protein O-mannosyl transferase
MRGYFAIAMCSFAFVGLIYGWVWWFRIGRRQSAPHTGRLIATLVYSTLLPFAFSFFYPLCLSLKEKY